MPQNVLDINLVFTILMICATLLAAVWLRKPEKITEAADKARTDPQLISALEGRYNSNDANKMLFDALNSAISFLHRSVPTESTFYQPIAAVDALVDEVTDGVPEASKEVLTAVAQTKPENAGAEKTVTVTMPAEKGTSVEIV